MDLFLRPGDWYKAQSYITTLAEKHRMHEAYANLVGILLPPIGGLTDVEVVSAIPMEAYPINRHVRGALRSLRKLACDDEQVLHEVVTCYAGSERSSCNERHLHVSDEQKSHICRFVEEYGPLIHDFSDFCRPFRNTTLMFAFEYSETLRKIGREYQLFGEEWAGYSAGLRASGLVSSNLAPLLATPVGLYVWAADMLTALKKYPEWPGCQLFLTNRMMALRMLPEPMAKKSSTSIAGELIDFLALNVAYGITDMSDREPITCANPDCGAVFFLDDDDRRRRYCDACRSDKVLYQAIRAAKYRRKDKGKG